MRLHLLFACLSCIGSISQAHEFWIAPEVYRVAVDAPLNAHIRVGQSFKGGAYSYIARNTERFEVQQGATIYPHEAVLGDRPALKRSLPQNGLAVVVHETTDSTLTYREFKKFENFVQHKDFSGALEAHAARGLPQTGFVESYRRYAKSLIAVGDGAGADRNVGLDTEITALANPYTDDLSKGLPVRVTLYGAPRADAQVEVYRRDKTGVSVDLYRTDPQGIATLNVAPGAEYQVDAVVLEPRDGTGDNGAVWHSMWANLTFAVPD